MSLWRSWHPWRLTRICWNYWQRSRGSCASPERGPATIESGLVCPSGDGRLLGCRCTSRLRMRPASVSTDSLNCRSDGGARGRGMHTKSHGGSSCCLSRKASRNSRFQRFRCVALPILRDTARPSRGWPNWFAAPYSTIQASPAEERSANTRSKSLPFSRRRPFGNR